MIPRLSDITIGQPIEIVQQPSLTYKADFQTGVISKSIDSLEAMEQAIHKILHTERYEHAIYNWNYGLELADLYGKPRAYVYSELKRRIKEALMQDDRITEVENFVFEKPERGGVMVRFTIHTIFGDIDTGRQVSM